MRKLIHVLAISTLLVSTMALGAAQRTENKIAGWDAAPAILARIKPPEFPARDFDITRFGAVANGQTDSTEAIRKAIDACHNAGGGRVAVPAGVFLTGAIHLQSNVNLFVAEGATLKFSTDPEMYLPAVYTRFEGRLTMELT